MLLPRGRLQGAGPAQPHGTPPGCHTANAPTTALPTACQLTIQQSCAAVPHELERALGFPEPSTFRMGSGAHLCLPYSTPGGGEGAIACFRSFGRFGWWDKVNKRERDRGHRLPLWPVPREVSRGKRFAHARAQGFARCRPLRACMLFSPCTCRLVQLVRTDRTLPTPPQRCCRRPCASCRSSPSS